MSKTTKIEKHHVYKTSLSVLKRSEMYFRCKLNMTKNMCVPTQ